MFKKNDKTYVKNGNKYVKLPKHSKPPKATKVKVPNFNFDTDYASIANKGKNLNYDWY